MIPKSGNRFSEKRSCSNKELERDDDWKKNHPALGDRPNAGSRDMFGVRQLRQCVGFLAALMRCRASPLVLAAALACGAAPAVGQTPIKFSLDGTIEGPEALFLFPEDKCYFRSEGPEVTIDEALPPLDPITRVASGAYELGFADFNGLIRYRDQHPTAPIKAIFVVYNKPPYGVVAGKTRGLTAPKPTENTSIGVQAG